jgi:hypothetical protein
LEKLRPLSTAALKYYHNYAWNARYERSFYGFSSRKYRCEQPFFTSRQDLPEDGFTRAGRSKNAQTLGP